MQAKAAVRAITVKRFSKQAIQQTVTNAIRSRMDERYRKAPEVFGAFLFSKSMVSSA
jgi:hypothetical protein